MSQELINAAIAGDEAQVKALLPRADINYVGEMNFDWIGNINPPKNGEKVRCTALSAAVAYGEYGIVCLLLSAHAKLKIRSNPVDNYDYTDAYRNFSLNFFPEPGENNYHRLNKEIFRELLKHTLEIELDLYRWQVTYTSSPLFSDLLLNRDLPPFIHECVQAVQPHLADYLLYESALRNDREFFNKIRKLRSDNMESRFISYLKQRGLMNIDAKTAQKGLAFLFENQSISSESYSELLQYVNQHAVVALDVFPSQFQAQLTMPPKLSLLELFSQFRHGFCKEEGLPNLPVSRLPNLDDYLQAGESPEQAKARIQYLQNPAHLTTLISLDAAEIMRRFFVNDAPDGANDTIVLLALMVVYKASETVIVNNKVVPLLDEANKQKALKLIYRYFALSVAEKLTLSLQVKLDAVQSGQDAKIALLEIDNAQKTQQIADLTAKVATLSAQCAELMQFMHQQAIVGNTGEAAAMTQSALKLFKRS